MQQTVLLMSAFSSIVEDLQQAELCLCWLSKRETLMCLSGKLFSQMHYILSAHCYALLQTVLLMSAFSSIVEDLQQAELCLLGSSREAQPS